MESHLKGNIWLLPELGLNIFPSKSTIHRAMMRLGMETLIELNDSVLSRLKNVEEKGSEERTQTEGINIQPIDKRKTASQIRVVCQSQLFNKR